MAMKEAFQEDNPSQNELEQSSIVSHPENPSDGNGRMTTRKRTAKKTEVNKKKKKNEEPYIAKVEQLAKLKQKQEEDKADVRLHCFSKTCEDDEDVSLSPEGLKQMQSLKQGVKPSDIQGPVDTLFPEVILCVEIYNSRKSKTQEFLVLGHQVLTELKDKIHCLTNQVMEKAGKYDPSGYFLIEDIFHNDLRSPSATDYSKPILDWLWNSKDEAVKKWEGIITGELKQKQKAVLGEQKAMGLPCFGSADMQSTRFCDLRFRLGASYLYCHQGDCKHMIVIRDMRLSHPEDVQNRAAYPRLTYRLKVKAHKCGVCSIYRATKVALDDKWAKENPCYFCDMCFDQLHNEGSSLKCDFPVFDYVYE
ncbi:hypothetical protein EUTSA_v10008005mg [Eutrema salsugineum]|uniref:snRNA-activating protein complex subunit n=1 Tax=Eutrema salsugineum TaxID=72664 RepID=V4MQN9_EUTSA|nr:hypothetical protein EUTSA_v10008005mg [Eutrema salsugineum]